MLDQLSDEFLGQNKNASIQNYDVEFLVQNKNLILIQNYHVEFLGQNKNFLIQNYDVGFQNSFFSPSSLILKHF